MKHFFFSLFFPLFFQTLPLDIHWKSNAGTGFGSESNSDYDVRFYCSVTTANSCDPSENGNLTSRPNCEERPSLNVTRVSFESLLAEVDLTGCIGLVYAYIIWQGIGATDIILAPSISTIVNVEDTSISQGLVAGQTQSITILGDGFTKDVSFDSNPNAYQIRITAQGCDCDVSARYDRISTSKIVFIATLQDACPRDSRILAYAELNVDQIGYLSPVAIGTIVTVRNTSSEQLLSYGDNNARLDIFGYGFTLQESQSYVLTIITTGLNVDGQQVGTCASLSYDTLNRLSNNTLRVTGLNMSSGCEGTIQASLSYGGMSTASSTLNNDVANVLSMFDTTISTGLAANVQSSITISGHGFHYDENVISDGVFGMSVSCDTLIGQFSETDRALVSSIPNSDILVLNNDALVASNVDLFNCARGGVVYAALSFTSISNDLYAITATTAVGAVVSIRNTSSEIALLSEENATVQIRGTGLVFTNLSRYTVTITGDECDVNSQRFDSVATQPVCVENNQVGEAPYICSLDVSTQVNLLGCTGTIYADLSVSLDDGVVASVPVSAIATIVTVTDTSQLVALPPVFTSIAITVEGSGFASPFGSDYVIVVQSAGNCTSTLSVDPVQDGNISSSGTTIAVLVQKSSPDTVRCSGVFTMSMEFRSSIFSFSAATFISINSPQSNVFVPSISGSQMFTIQGAGFVSGNTDDYSVVLYCGSKTISTSILEIQSTNDLVLSTATSTLRTFYVSPCPPPTSLSLSLSLSPLNTYSIHTTTIHTQVRRIVSLLR